MPSNGELGISIYLLCGASFSWIPTTIIRRYLKHKPIGLQTILDQVAIDLTYAIQFGAVNFFLGIATGFLVRLELLGLVELV